MRDVNDISNCTNATLRKANRLIGQAFDNQLQPSGLKATQFTLLATLDKMGVAGVTQLAQVMVMDRTTLSRNLKPLLNKGLIQVLGDQDQRVRQMQLTAQGRSMYEKALPYWEAIQNKVVQRIGKERWEQFLQDLDTTIEVMSDNS